MTIEFEDHSEEGQQLLLRHLESEKPEAVKPPKLNCFWRLIGRLYVGFLRWRYREPRH